MLGPFAANGGGPQQALPHQAALIEQIFRPLPQRPAQPVVERHAEAHLAPLHQLARHMAIEDLAQRPLAAALANLDGERQAPGEFHHPVVQQGHARLEADGHAGAIHLHQDVVGEVHDGVAIHHAMGDLPQGRAAIGIVESGQGIGSLDHHRLRGSPVREQLRVSGLPVGRVQKADQPSRLAPQEASGNQPGAAGQQRAERGPHGGGHPSHRARVFPADLVTCVAGEQLVSAVTGERHGDIAAGEL